MNNTIVGMSTLLLILVAGVIVTSIGISNVYAISPTVGIAVSLTFPDRSLNGPIGITTLTIDNKHYALVASFDGDAIQIINITDPANPVAGKSIRNTAPDTFLDGARSITTLTIDNKHYALVASFTDDAIQIINITDPANPVAGESISNTAPDTFLDGPTGITTLTIDDKHYALVASRYSSAIQIINITDPANPVVGNAIYDIIHDDRFLDASGITTLTIDDKHYALVASFDGDAIQIINVTDPANIVAGESISNTVPDTFLDGAIRITTLTIDDKHYALVASFTDDAVQIINITDPTNPVAGESIRNTVPDTFLDGASDIAILTIDNKHYALVTSFTDDAVQIINITDPTNPVAGESLSNTAPDTLLDDDDSILGALLLPDDDSIPNTAPDPMLSGARDITTLTINNKHYALVTSFTDDAVQIIHLISSIPSPILLNIECTDVLLCSDDVLTDIDCPGDPSCPITGNNFPNNPPPVTRDYDSKPFRQTTTSGGGIAFTMAPNILIHNIFDYPYKFRLVASTYGDNLYAKIHDKTNSYIGKDVTTSSNYKQYVAFSDGKINFHIFDFVIDGEIDLNDFRVTIHDKSKKTAYYDTKISNSNPSKDFIILWVPGSLKLNTDYDDRFSLETDLIENKDEITRQSKLWLSQTSNTKDYVDFIRQKIDFKELIIHDDPEYNDYILRIKYSINSWINGYSNDDVFRADLESLLRLVDHDQ